MSADLLVVDLLVALALAAGGFFIFFARSHAEVRFAMQRLYLFFLGGYFIRIVVVYSESIVPVSSLGLIVLFAFIAFVIASCILLVRVCGNCGKTNIATRERRCKSCGWSIALRSTNRRKSEKSGSERSDLPS